MKIRIITILVLFLSNSLVAEADDWDIVKLEEELHKGAPFRMPKQTNIVFSNGKTFQTKIIEFKLLASIRSDENIPFLIFQMFAIIFGLGHCISQPCDINRPLINVVILQYSEYTFSNNNFYARI